MKIDGRIIAQKILGRLKQTVSKSRLRPTLAVILIGEDPSSVSYIKQKQKAADFIGAKIIVKRFNNLTMKQFNNETIIKLIGELNKDNKVNGIIVQLPLPEHLNPKQILAHITPSKDVDGFTPNSPFTPPVAGAVLKVLEEIQKPKVDGNRWRNSKFLVIGRGLTAGQPIVKTLKRLGCKVSVAHSQTRLDQLAKLVKSASVIISCVGKPDVIKASQIKKGAIVIGVGIHRETRHLGGGRMDSSEVKSVLVGDFNEEKISKVASFYTPTPGGLGPINVACLMENLLKASQKITH